MILAVTTKKPINRHSMGAEYVPQTVKDAVLKMLYESPAPLRFTDLMDGLQKPNRTVYVNLKELGQKAFVANETHRYRLTPEGRREYEKRRALAGLQVALMDAVDSLRAEGKPSDTSVLGEGEWVWVPRQTSLALKERSEKQKVPVWRVIDSLLGTTEEQSR